MMGRYYNETNLKRAQELAAIARARGGRRPRQLAIAWILARPAVSSVILGVRTLEQLKDNLAAATLKLAPDIIAQLEGVFPKGED